MLRGPEARDRAAVIEPFASSEVGTYIGGPRPRDELERAVPDGPGGASVVSTSSAANSASEVTWLRPT